MPLALRQLPLDGSIENLRRCAMELGNVVGGSAGSDVPDHVSRYISTLECAEAQLRSIFADPAVWTRLHGDNYWAIRSLTSASPRPMVLINGEAEEQQRYLEGLMEQLIRLRDRLAVAPGKLVMPDTNVLLHYLPPSQIDWKSVVGVDRVRLILPLRVVEELDERKYGGRGDLADRARRLLSALWALLEPTKGAPAAFVDGVTIELPVEDGARRRTLDADEEVLAECATLAAVGAPVTLVTGDTGMSLRATGRNIAVTRMPEKFLRVRPTANDDGSPGI